MDTEKGKAIGKEVAKLLFAFEKSETYEKWKLRGLKKNLSVKTGQLES